MTSKASKWLNTSEMQAWRSYIVSSRRLFEALESDLSEHGLTLPDYEMLVHLSEAPDRTMRMSDLAEKAMMSRSRLSHRIKAMEKAGWVKRQACASDKRGSFAVMTAKGWNTIKSAAPDHIASVRERFIQHLSKKDQAAVADVFGRIENELRNEIIED